jgi:galactose mutarotase-like enzyme
VLRVTIFLLAASITVLSGAERYHFSDATAKGPAQPPLIVLHDEEAGIRAAVAPSEGGELSGLELRFRDRWIETVYRARDYTPIDGFAGRAMVLWPATGRNVLDKQQPFGYELNGKRYPMPAHGFVRSMPWKVISRRAASDGLELVLAISDTADTRQSYPFGFEVSVAYRVSDGELALVYTVRASGDNPSPMPFSIGNHIAFLAPLVPGGDAGKVLFESPSTLEYVKDPPGLPNGKSRSLSYAKPTPLSEIPRLTAISLAGYQDDPYMELRDPQGLSIRMTHTATSIPDEPVIRYNLWGDLEGGFFSPEPWVGLQNSFNLNQGLVRLNPGQEWEWTIRIQPGRHATP